MDEFEFIKGLSASVGLIIFGTFFIAMIIWVMRPSAKKEFEDHGKAIIDEEEKHG